MAASTFNRRAAGGWAALSAGLLLLPGCGGVAPALVQPLPVVVQPAGQPWGVEVALAVDDAIHLDMANTSPRPVRVLWDECVYIDAEQEAHRVLTASAWAHKDFGPQVPAQLAPGSRLRETLYPVGANRERVGPIVPPPPSWKERFWVGLKRWLFFQWKARVHQPPPHTVGIFLVLEDYSGRKTLMAPYAIGGLPASPAVPGAPAPLVLPR